MLTVGDRAENASGLEAGWSIRVIPEHIGRCSSVVSREVGRNGAKTRGYKIVTADCRARRRRARPQVGKVAADPVLRHRVLVDLKRSRTPRQIAGRLHLEAVPDEPVPGVRPRAAVETDVERFPVQRRGGGCPGRRGF